MWSSTVDSSALQARGGRCTSTRETGQYPSSQRLSTVALVTLCRRSGVEIICAQCSIKCKFTLPGYIVKGNSLHMLAGLQ